MKTLLAKLTGTILFALLALTSQAQITGTVKDSVSQQAMPYATITLKQYSNASFVQATITNDKGDFQFENLPQELYYLTADFLGYKKVRIDSLQIGEGTKFKKLQIILSSDAKLLKAVKVIGQKQFIEQRADKLIVNVEASPIAAGGTTDEVIARAPGVVEQNGNYLVRGKNVMVLIDGKNTNLSGSDLKDLLSSMPSNGISKVEVIANPSAKYDAAGGAVINIVTTKSKNYGTNGTLTLGAGAGQRARYNGGLSLNHRSQKLNVYGSYDFLHNQPYSRLQSNRRLSQESQVDEQSFELRTLNNNSFKTGFDYELSKRSSFGVLLRGMVNNRNREGSNSSFVAQINGTPISSSIVEMNGQSQVISPSVNAYYKTILDTLGTELKIAADYFGYNKDWQNQFATRYFNAAGEESQVGTFLRDNSPANNAIQTITADLTRPMKKGTLELGLKSTFTKTDNDIFWEGRTAETNWEVDNGKTNHFIYKENINAAYASYSTTYKKLSLQMGLRAEQTYTKGTSVTLNQINTNNYFNLFPSAAVQYNASKKQQFGLAYRRKIDRFRFDIVNPFVTYISQYSYAQGNPNVKPSISHNFEVSHSFNNELYTAVSYGYHKNVLSEIVRPLEGTQAVVSSYANFNTGHELSGTISHMKSLFSNKWNTNNTVGFMYANIKGGAGAQFSSSKPALMFSSNNSIQLGHGIKGEVSASYMSPLTFGAFTFKAQYSGSIGFSKSVLNNAGTLSLNVTDVFNTVRNRYETESFGVTSTNEGKVESRFVRLGFSYKFGNKNVKGSKTRKTGIEEEKSRMESN